MAIDDALEALSSWARRRDRLPEDRADLVAAAWHSGARNVAELATRADVSRDTIYSDLRARDIDRRHRDAAPTPAASPGALRPVTVAEIARLTGEALLPAMVQTDEPAPLTTAAWQMSIGYERLAELVDELPPDRVAEVSADLADRLKMALREVHRHWASTQTQAELAAQTEAAQIDSLDDQALVSGATLTLVLPTGQSITVELSEARDSLAGPGWSTARSDSGLLKAPLEGTDHLELRAAFDIIGQVLTRHLGPEAFED